MDSLTIVPTHEHPAYASVLGFTRSARAAKPVWFGSERDTTRRHLPAVFLVTGGFLLCWAEPGRPFRGASVLELFGTETEARTAWASLARPPP